MLMEIRLFFKKSLQLKRVQLDILSRFTGDEPFY